MRTERASIPERETAPALWADATFRKAMALWVVLVVVVAIKAIVSPRHHTVFPLLMSGPRHWWAGKDIYDVYPELFDIYRYSPSNALLFSPLAPLPDRVGGAIWCVVNLGVLVFGLIAAARHVFPGRWPAARIGGLLALVMVGAIRSGWNSQSNPLVIGLILLGASAIARDRGWSAAVLLAIPIFMKLSPLAIALLFVALWPRQLLARFLAVMAAGVALPFLTMPTQFVVSQYQHWIVGLAQSSATRWPAFRDAYTLWELTGYPVHLPAYRALQLGAGLATLFWSQWLARRLPGARGRLTATLAMGTAYLLVFGPAVEYPSYVVLTPMVAWGVLAAYRRRKGRVWVTLAFALTVVVGSEAIEVPLDRLTPLARASLPLGSILFAAWVARYARTMTSEADREPEPEPELSASGRKWERRRWRRGAVGRDCPITAR